MREVVGVELVLLLLRGDAVERLNTNGTKAKRPNFCSLIRNTEEGLKKCLTCRSLLALKASYRGLTEHSCHGGISSIAAPVISHNSSRLIIVSSCAFMRKGDSVNDKLIRKQAKDLSIDTKQLDKACHRLPILTEDRFKMVEAIVSIAASLISEIIDFSHFSGDDDTDFAIDHDVSAGITRKVENALYMSRDSSFDAPGDASGSAFAMLVSAMVESSPSLPYTVSAIAKAARMTPNHFSMLFHKQTGKSFIRFLSEKRIELAKELLLDLTLSVSEVAYKAGFNDTGYFSRRFKMIEGVTPTQWRDSL